MENTDNSIISTMLHKHSDEYTNNKFIYLLTLISSLGGFLFGYDTGVIAGALLSVSNDFDLTNIQKELIVSMTLIGALVSSLIIGSYVDKYGRKPIINISIILYIMGSFLLALSFNYSMLLIGRLLVGLAIGVSSFTIPIYLSESAPSSSRGFLVTCFNVSITFGQFFSILLASGFIYLSNGWRYMFGFAVIPAVIQLIGFLFLSESPRWLIVNNHIDIATLTLQKLRDRIDVRQEISDILLSIHLTSNSATNHYKEMYSNILIRRAVILGCVLQAAQQLSGINAIMYYSTIIVSYTGFVSTQQAIILLSSCLSFFNFFGSIVSLYLVDKVGRRQLVLSSLLGIIILLSSLSVCFYLLMSTSNHSDIYNNNNLLDYVANYIPKYLSYSQNRLLSDSQCNNYKTCFDCIQDLSCGYCNSIPIDNVIYQGCIQLSSSSSSIYDKTSVPLNETQCPYSDSLYLSTCPNSDLYGYLIFILLSIYLFIYAIGMGSMPWCITSEIYPTNIRGSCNSVTTSVNWITNLLVSVTFLTTNQYLSIYITLVIYISITSVLSLYLYNYLPETKDVSLENILDLFSNNYWGKNPSKSFSYLSSNNVSYNRLHVNDIDKDSSNNINNSKYDDDRESDNNVDSPLSIQTHRTSDSPIDDVKYRYGKSFDISSLNNLHDNSMIRPHSSFSQLSNKSFKRPSRSRLSLTEPIEPILSNYVYESDTDTEV